MCEAVSDACLRLSHSGLFTNPSLNRCPFKWQRPTSSPANILSWFLLRLSKVATEARHFLKITLLNTWKLCVFWLVTKTFLLCFYSFFNHKSGDQNMGLFTFRGALPTRLQSTPQSVKQIFYCTFIQLKRQTTKLWPKQVRLKGWMLKLNESDVFDASGNIHIVQLNPVYSLIII
jgi:hypothetical protein